MDSMHQIMVARGKKEADLVLKNCRIINVYSGMVEEGDIAIVDNRIVGIGQYEGHEVVDVEGRYVCPGLIDGHVHIESSMLIPSVFSQTVLPKGTTTVIADPHEIANVAGIEGIRFMIEDSIETPLDIYYMLPSCVPSTQFENAGAILTAEHLEPLFEEPLVLGLGEMMNYPGVIYGQTDTFKKLKIAAGKIIDGHGPGLSGNDLNAYISAGVMTDHECTTVAEMAEKLNRGMFILIREGSATKNLATLVKGVTAHNSHRIGFCTDDKHPEDILKDGHIDYNVRLAIAQGVDPIMAIQMATINTARFYRLYDRGAIAPGQLADLIILNDLKSFRVDRVYKAGICVGIDQNAQFEVKSKDAKSLRDSVNIKDYENIDLDIYLESDVVHVIRMAPESIVTENVVRKVDVKEGKYAYNSKLGILKLAVIERHHATGYRGLGLIEGFGLKEGAIALTIAHDSHNLIVVGDNDADMRQAISNVKELGGGITLVHHGRTIGTVKLDIGGLMTDRSITELEEELSFLSMQARLQGVNEGIDPFMSLAFMALPVIPELKLTDQGLFDAVAFRHIRLEA